MAYGESNNHVTDDVKWPRKVKLVTPIRLIRPQYLENSWRCYLATIANYYRVCCEVVRTVGYPSDSLASCLIVSVLAANTGRVHVWKLTFIWRPACVVRPTWRLMANDQASCKELCAVGRQTYDSRDDRFASFCRFHLGKWSRGSVDCACWYLVASYKPLNLTDSNRVTQSSHQCRVLPWMVTARNFIVCASSNIRLSASALL